MQTQKLPVRLDEQELLLRGRSLASTEDKYEEVQALSKAEAKLRKDELDGMRADILKLSKQITSGYEWREVETVERQDWDTQERLTLRCDTGEIVDRRPMTPYEVKRGRSLFEGEDQGSTVTSTHGAKSVSLTGHQFDQA